MAYMVVVVIQLDVIGQICRCASISKWSFYLFLVGGGFCGCVVLLCCMFAMKCLLRWFLLGGSVCSVLCGSVIRCRIVIVRCFPCSDVSSTAAVVLVSLVSVSSWARFRSIGVWACPVR